MARLVCLHDSGFSSRADAQKRLYTANSVADRRARCLRAAEARLYRHEIDDGPTLARHVDAFLDIYNARRPHEALDFALPLDRYLRPPPITLEPAVQVGLCGTRP